MGNGAFVLSHRVVNEKLELTPNPYYWDRAHTVLTRVTFVPINQESAATHRYLAGDLHHRILPHEQYQSLMAQIQGRSIPRNSSAPTTTPSTPSARPSMMCGCARRSPTPSTGA